MQASTVHELVYVASLSEYSDLHTFVCIKSCHLHNQVPDEAPSSVNFWSHLPSPSNMHSSQSSVLDNLGSASLPIEQLQLKASLPGVAVPIQLPAPWGTGSTDNSPSVPHSVAMQGSSQTPWLPAWSQKMMQKPTMAQTHDCAKGPNTSLKRSCSPDENGEPVDSKPTKQRKLHELQRCCSGGANACNHDCQQPAQQVKHTKHETVLQEAKDNNADTGSPNTSSHSSSPEHAVMEPDGQAAAPV